MRFGACTSIEQSEKWKGAGFDYIEVAAAPMREEGWSPAPYVTADVEATNLFFPGGIHLYDGSFDAIEHVEIVGVCAAAVYAELMVIGSGGQRRHPDGPETGLGAFVDLVRAMQDAFPHLPLVPESLNRTETNVGTDLGKLALALKERGLGYTADVYHVLKEWDSDGREGGLDVPTEAFWASQLPHLPSHVHLSSFDRTLPSEDDPMVLGFLRRLQSLGYDGKISLEGSFTEDQVLRARPVLDRLVSAAGF